MIEPTALNILLAAIGVTVWMFALTFGIIGLAEITYRVSHGKDQ